MLKQLKFYWIAIMKVMRGGAYNYFDSDCRSARRLYFHPNLTDSDVGFRVVLAAGPP
jgi:formylglycine-generating enzyme required for sulfatase activity